MKGKTLLARTLAKVLDVPFSVSDATSFTQVCCEVAWLFECLIPDCPGWLYVNSPRRKMTKLPFMQIDVGEDVDMCIHRLVRVLPL